MPAVASPPKSEPADLNSVPLGQIAAEYADRVGKIVGGSDTSSRPRSQFNSSV
jgi:hypothetical protein